MLQVVANIVRPYSTRQPVRFQILELMWHTLWVGAIAFVESQSLSVDGDLAATFPIQFMLAMGLRSLGYGLACSVSASSLYRVFVSRAQLSLSPGEYLSSLVALPYCLQLALGCCVWLVGNRTPFVMGLGMACDVSFSIALFGIALVLAPSAWWRLVVGFSAVCVFANTLLFVMMPEGSSHRLVNDIPSWFGIIAGAAGVCAVAADCTLPPTLAESVPRASMHWCGLLSWMLTLVAPSLWNLFPYL